MPSLFTFPFGARLYFQNGRFEESDVSNHFEAARVGQ